MMKRNFIWLFVLVSCVGMGGCKKFLDVKPLDRLVGNAFFQDRQDIENNLWDTYGLLRDKLASCPFLPASGDLRSGMMGASKEVSGRQYRVWIPTNELNTLVTNQQDWLSTFHWDNLTTWKGFYQVILASNNLYYELDRRPIAGVGATDIKRYQAETVVLRCLAYFFMIRVWGDVPYFTDAYHENPLPRTKMAQVADSCLQELAKVKDNLPWSYSDPAYLGVRASRGSLIALMMNLDMWNAGFDKANAKKYEQQAAELGKELIDSKAYELLPMADFHTIFKGRTKESLFEIVQNSNYGEVIQYQTFADMVLHYPYKRPSNTHQYSFTYYRASFLDLLYPPGQPDTRVDYWFDQDMYADNGNFQYLKFTNIFAVGANEDVNPDNDLIIFRYAGILLLRAEALNDLGQTAEAIKMLNLVRARADAPLYTGAGGPALDDAIFAERAKELMGEGHYYYDLVRTGRVMNATWDFYPLTQSQFNDGAWTWPLSASTQSHNPYIQLNTYWLK